MSRTIFIWRGLALSAVLLLGACQNGAPGNPFAGDKPYAGAGAATLPADAGGERDVEAPETFKLTDKALWDGRPSLGGVWVAHASVSDPERVVIRNASNGKSVVGALFRREVENPGPSLQLSSDAAEALGLLAGQPAVVEVVALKRIEAPQPAAAPAATTAATEAPATKEAAANKEAAAGTTAKTDPAAGTGKKKPKEKPAIEEKPLDPITTTAAAAIEKAASGSKNAAPAVAPAPSGALKRAYVQIGIFSVEANANKAATQMQKAGMGAAVKADTSQGKNFWRVIVGPAATEADRNALAAKVKALGYPDAYPVSQ